MNRTRKWAFVSQEATRLADMGLSPREIADRLNLSKSTVTRWMTAGKIARTARGQARPVRPPVTARSRMTPAQWAASVRGAYQLDSTDDQLVTIAESALALTLDQTVAPQVRMAAASRFQGIVKQLALVARNAAADQLEPKPAEEPKRTLRVVRTGGADPRTALMGGKQ